MGLSPIEARIQQELAWLQAPLIESQGALPQIQDWAFPAPSRLQRDALSPAGPSPAGFFAQGNSRKSGNRFPSGIYIKNKEIERSAIP